jgi:hypothetical protein
MNDFNLIDEFEEDLWLLESDDNSSHSEDENDRQKRRRIAKNVTGRHRRHL